MYRCHVICRERNHNIRKNIIILRITINHERLLPLVRLLVLIGLSDSPAKKEEDRDRKNEEDKDRTKEDDEDRTKEDGKYRTKEDNADRTKEENEYREKEDYEDWAIEHSRG